MKTLKISIVDDHALFRLGERTIITEKLPNAVIIGDYSSGEELIVNLRNGIIPDVILLDIIMPNMNGIEAAKIIKNQYPDIKIIMLSSEVSPHVINELLDIGIDGYLSKLAVNDDLIQAIKSTVSGNLFYGREIALIMYQIHITKKNNKKRTILKSFNKSKELSKREEEIFLLLCEGVSIKDIAKRLYISEKTVGNHKANIMKKMGFKTYADMIRYAVKENIIVP